MTFFKEKFMSIANVTELRNKNREALEYKKLARTNTDSAQNFAKYSTLVGELQLFDDIFKMDMYSFARHASEQSEYLTNALAPECEITLMTDNLDVTTEEGKDFVGNPIYIRQIPVKYNLAFIQKVKDLDSGRFNTKISKLPITITNFQLTTNYNDVEKEIQEIQNTALNKEVLENVRVDLLNDAVLHLDSYLGDATHFDDIQVSDLLWNVVYSHNSEKADKQIDLNSKTIYKLEDEIVDLQHDGLVR